VATADGASTESYNEISSYDGSSREFVLDNTVETTYISGTIYRFIFSATNEIGEG
jgi:hypothetical protein